MGDHDCEDGLPIALDWKFNPISRMEAVEQDHEVYTRHYPARRLTYFERSVRLAEVSGIKVIGSGVDDTTATTPQERILDTMAHLQQLHHDGPTGHMPITVQFPRQNKTTAPTAATAVVVASVAA